MSRMGPTSMLGATAVAGEGVADVAEPVLVLLFPAVDVSPGVAASALVPNIAPLIFPKMLIVSLLFHVKERIKR